MTQESAIVEEQAIETSDAQDSPQPDPVIDDYEIDEPDDDSDEFQVPVIDDLDANDDEPVPSSDKKAPVPPKTSEKSEDDAGEEAKETTPTPALPEALVAKAKKLGVSDEDISLFGEQQLERLCSLMQPQSNQQPQPKPDADNPDGEFKIELDPELYEPGICKAMESTASEINGIKKALSEVVSAVRRQSEASFEQTFETMIAGLGDEFTETFGKGTLDEIGTDGDFFKNRCKLVDEMNAIASGYAQMGKTVPVPRQLFQRALNSVFGETIKSNTRKQVAAQLQQRAGQIISRPMGKKGKEAQTPEQRATTAVKEKLRQFGADDETDIQDDF